MKTEALMERVQAAAAARKTIERTAVAVLEGLGLTVTLNTHRKELLDPISLGGEFASPLPAEVNANEEIRSVEDAFQALRDLRAGYAEVVQTIKGSLRDAGLDPVTVERYTWGDNPYVFSVTVRVSAGSPRAAESPS